MTSPDQESPEQTEEQTAEPSRGEVSLTRLQVLHLLFVAIAAGAGLYFSREMAYGILLGGALMAANLRIIVGVMRSVFGKGSGSALNVGLYWAKFAILMLVVGILIAILGIDPVGLLIGLSIFVVAIIVEATARLLQS